MSGENQNFPTFHDEYGNAVRPPTPQIYDWQNVRAPGQHGGTSAFNFATPQPPVPQQGSQVPAGQDKPTVDFGRPVPMPLTPTSHDWQIEAAYNADVPPPPPPETQNQHQDQNPNQGPLTTKDPPPQISGTTSELYANTTLADFPIAGQVKRGKMVKKSEFAAKTEMKEDGVQHSVGTDWQYQGESGGNAHRQEWFENRGG